MADPDPNAAAAASAASPASAAAPAQPEPPSPPESAAVLSAPRAYEGSEPSLLQTVGEKEPAPGPANVPEKPAAADAGKPAEAAGEPPKPGEQPAAPSEAKPAEVKPADAKPPEGAKPEEKPAEAKPAEVEYKYELPETIKLDDAHKTELHGVLDAYRADPGNVQPLIDYHAARIAEARAEIDKSNRSAFNDIRRENRKAIMADPVLGGSGHQTTAGAVARMRDMLTPSEMLAPRKNNDGSPRLSEADEFFELTGAGDHPVFWHILHNAARYLDEPQAASLPANVRPQGNSKSVSPRPPKSRLRELYDNPRSNGQA